MAGFVLDSGAVITLASGNTRARRFLVDAIRQDRQVILPTVVTAETVRGSVRDARINRVINEVGRIVPITEAVARLAGQLLARAGGNPTIDVLVVAVAILGREATILLTGDVDDLTRLADNYPLIRVLGI